MVQVVDLDRGGTKPFGSPANIKADPHSWPQKVDVLTRCPKQRHKREDKRDLFTAVTVDNAGLVTPEDLTNDAVVEVVPRLLSVIVGEVCIFFHGLCEEHLVHGAPGWHHREHTFTLWNDDIHHRRTGRSKRFFESL